MKLISAVVRPNKLDDVKAALGEIDVHGLTVTEVKGHGRQKGHKEIFRGKEYMVDLLPKVRLELALPDSKVNDAVVAIEKASKTGDVGDGKIFIMPIDDCIRIRTGERGDDAL